MKKTPDIIHEGTREVVVTRTMGFKRFDPSDPELIPDPDRRMGDMVRAATFTGRTIYGIIKGIDYTKRSRLKYYIGVRGGRECAWVKDVTLVSREEYDQS